MTIAEAFNELVSEYSESIVRWVPNYQEMLEGIVRFVPDNFAPKTILELGCGNGNLSLLALHRHPSAQLTAVDISTDMLAMAKERLANKKVDFHHCLIQDFKGKAEQFDWIIAAMAIHHLPAADKQQLFKEAYRWLKPGGMICMGDLMIDKEDRPWHDHHLRVWQEQAAQKKTTPAEWEHIMEHYADYDRPSDWLKQIQWLEDAGFKIVETPYRKMGWTVLCAQK